MLSTFDLQAAIADPAEEEPAITDLPDQYQQIEPSSEQFAAALDEQFQGHPQEQPQEPPEEQQQAAAEERKPLKRSKVKKEVKEEAEEDQAAAQPRC